DRAVNAGPARRYRFEQQPGNRVGVGRTPVQTRADNFAAAVTLPGWTRVVLADFAVVVRIREQRRGRRDEHPTVAVPSIYLHTVGIHTRVQLVSLWYPHAVAKRRRQIGTILVPGWFGGDGGR